MAFRCTFGQINLLICRFSLHSQVPCVGTLCATPVGQGGSGQGGMLWYVRAYGANCQLTAKQAQANNVTQTNSHNQPEREVNQKQNAGNWPPAFTGLPGRTGPGHIAHWFYLLIRTLCCFYLIFMPAAISISVIELSLSRQVLVVPAPGGGEGLWLVLVGCPVVRLSTVWRLACPNVHSFAYRSMSKMVLRLIGVGQHPEVYKVMDVDGDANAGHIPEKGCGCFCSREREVRRGHSLANWFNWRWD